MSHKKPYINFENHRRLWVSDQFLRKTCVVSSNVATEKDSDVINFKRQLKNIPEQETYTIIGYGSLMNNSDITRTAKNANNHRLGFLDGYERIFNMGYDISYMNVREAPDRKEMQVALVDIPYSNLPNLILRERSYDFIEVDVFDSSVGEMIKALMVIGKLDSENDAVVPLLNYLHLCLTGLKKLNGLSGVRNFIRTTYCYSSRQNKHILIEEWLNEFNVVNYMFMYDYISR